ncbi:SDH family Clp fold serine proteinase [Ralstonia nicotianae]
MTTIDQICGALLTVGDDTDRGLGTTEEFRLDAEPPEIDQETTSTSGYKQIGNYDLIEYAGKINRIGYEELCNVLSKQCNKKAILVLTTTGGDPHAGFRIARALQHHYESFDALIPWLCKSAGTLICTGASHLYLDDQSELGPLDVQIKKGDEIIGRNSGLDILQAVNYLQSQAMAAFRTYVAELTHDAGLSTRTASDIASKLTAGLFSPIFAQLDPTRLAEMQRATDIAFAYGKRLNERSSNLRMKGLSMLVAGYPSHNFVIDRKEAKTIFVSVSKPEGVLAQVSRALHSASKADAHADSPMVRLLALGPSSGDSAGSSQQDTAQGESDEDVPDPN